MPYWGVHSELQGQLEQQLPMNPVCCCDKESGQVGKGVSADSLAQGWLPAVTMKAARITGVCPPHPYCGSVHACIVSIGARA